MIDTLKEIYKECGITLIPLHYLYTHRAFADKGWDGLGEFSKNVGGGFAYHSHTTKDGWRVVFYDDTVAPEQVVHILTHELGHHLLGHLSYREKEFEKDWAQNSKCMENEAQLFSVVITAMCLYDELKQRRVS